jgi:WD40 repeat protein
MAMDPDGTTLATAEADGSVRRRDVSTGAEHPPLLGHKGAVLRVRFSPDGATLGSAGQDGTVRLWNPATGTTTLILKLGTNRVRDLDVATGGSTVATCDGGSSVTLWNASGQKKWVLQCPQEVWRLAFSPDGATLAVGGGVYFQPSEVTLWDVASGQEKRRLSGTVDRVLGLAFSRDGRSLVTAGNEGVTRVWDPETGQLRSTIGGQSLEVSAVALAADGKTLAVGYRDTSLKLWDIVTGQHLATLAGHSGEIVRLEFSSNNHRLLSYGGDGTVRLWDPSAYRPMVLSGHQSHVHKVAFAHDGRTVATGGLDGVVHLWDTATGKRQASLSREVPIEDLDFSPSADYLAVAYGEPVVRLWDLTTRQPRNIPLDKLSMALAYSPDGSLLAIGTGDWKDTGPGTILLWDTATGRTRSILRGHRSPVAAVAFSPDGATLGSAGWNTEILLWDVSSGASRLLPAGHGGPIEALAFSPDGATLASASHDGTAKLWGVKTGRERATLSGHGALVSDLVFTKDGRTLATAGWDGSVKLWDVQTAQECATFYAHRQPLWGLAFSPDGTLLATASQDNTARLWRAADPARARDWSARVLIAEYEALAQDHGRSGLYAEAIADLTRAVELHEKLDKGGADQGPSYRHIARLSNHLAWLLATCPDAKLRQTDRAVVLAEKATTLEPEQGTYWNTLGVARYRAGRWEAAIKAIEKSMALRAGGDPYDWFTLTMLHSQQGRKDQAIVWFEKAVRWMADAKEQPEALVRFREEASVAVRK